MPISSRSDFVLVVLYKSPIDHLLSLKKTNSKCVVDLFELLYDTYNIEYSGRPVVDIL
jgi:hypothetical protein